MAADNSSVQSSTSSKTSSHSQEGQSDEMKAQTNQEFIERPDNTEIKDLVQEISNGIHKVAAELSKGLSLSKDTSEDKNSISSKSDSSLSSDMTAKLAQADLIPPDVITNW